MHFCFFFVLFFVFFSLLMRVLLVFAYVLCFFSFVMMLPFRRNKDEYISDIEQSDIIRRLSKIKLMLG